MSFKKTVSWILCLAIALTVMVTPAWAAVRHDDGGISVQYVNTRRITASLVLQDGVATCKGKVYPLDGKDCSITVTLYKKNGSGWDPVQSWSANASGGGYAIVNKTRSVEPGTYKVVSVGLVDGEQSTKESSAQTY